MLVDPTTRAGTYSLDDALRVGLLTGAKAYRSTGRNMHWYLVYEGNRIGRAIVVCYGFELLTLGVTHRFTFFQEVNEPVEPVELLPRRPQRWSVA